MPVAQASQIGDLLTGSLSVLQSLLLVIFGLMVVVFSWGIVKLIASAGNPEKLKQARAIIWYGIIGMLVFVSLWGIIAFFQTDLGLPSGTPVQPPQFRPQ